IYIYNKKSSINDSVVLIQSYQHNHLYKQGNGFIYKIEDYCYILTNYHVISDSDLVNVHINETNTKAFVLNYDEYDDLAIIVVDKRYGKSKLQLETEDFSEINDKITILTSKETKYGKIINITHPVKFNYDNRNKMLDLMELEVAIKEGDSGSPVISNNKKVIGITTMISADNQSVYAIPINDVINKINSLEHGNIYRVNLGIKAANNVQDFKGVLLEEVYEKELASIAGLTSGDVIVKINDIEVEDISDFRYYLYKIKRYELFEIEYYRNGIYYTTILMAI
ncbi:MAG: serine protease, partial [Bacilli bacterium]|nr:serine protease [Bacilli bacterium]